MKIHGVDMVDAGRKRESPEVAIPSTKEQSKVEHPYIEIGKSYNDIPVEIEGYKAGDKVVVVLHCEVERVSEQKVDEKGKGEKHEHTGRLKVLHAGIHSHSDASKMGEKEVSKTLDKELKE